MERKRTYEYAIQAWRTRAVHVLLIVVALIGLPAWGSVILNALREGQFSTLLWIYLAVYLAIVGLLLLPPHYQKARVWGLLALAYANGCASLLRLGLVGSGRLYLLLVPIFATILAGGRAGVLTSVLSLAIYALFTALVYLELLPETAADPSAFDHWLEAGIALAAFVLSSAVLIRRFLQFQMRTLYEEQRARTAWQETAAALEEAKQRLEAYSQTLELRVEQRTAELSEAKQRAEAASRRFEQELQLAGRIQASFMASDLPQIDNWQHATTLIPARATSGDFYNLFALPDGRYGILIADVVDKGVGAALFMALSWALIHTYAAEYPDEPSRVLSAVNRRILQDTHGDQFVTLFYGVLEPERGALVYANAGHYPPFHFLAAAPKEDDGPSGAGRVLPLPITGIPLGILPDETWGEEMIRMAPGDVLLLYTDGIVDAENAAAEMYGMDRLQALLRRYGRRSPEEIRHILLQAVERFAGEVAHSDDITLLILSRETGKERHVRAAKSRVDKEKAAA